ncbi:type II/IV secretion system protein [Candidatus Dojkabacteria bacterium]|nr:type II/IV secretion system protein [Candidatus Dojkabacteria bacterium]
MEQSQNNITTNVASLKTNYTPTPSGFGGQLLTQNILGILLTNNKITQNDLQVAQLDAVKNNIAVEQVLIKSGKISSDDVHQAKAQLKGYKYIDIGMLEIPINILNKISKDVAEKNLAVPFAEEDGKIKVAISDPEDLQKTKFLQVVMGKPLDVYYANPERIKNVIDKQYGARITSEVESALEDVGDIIEISSKKEDNNDISKEGLDSAPVSRIVNMMLEYAVKYEASDVHIEPRENNIVIRFRISGVMLEKLQLPRKLGPAVVSRIKILSNLKIDEHRLPQDGRFPIRVAKKYFDLRVSVMPNVFGEKVVMRLLERGGGGLSLDGTGLRGYALKAFLEGLKKTEGIILVTGPTGSGKTHTLASSLKILNKPEVNILTLEDPVEIRINGVTQVQVNADIGLTFASGMRAFLRQDPDIIMVGEIRDEETAKLAVTAALTGHLVLATLHTNSAAGAMPRLLNMNVESYLLSSTMNVIAAQRLARLICTNCKKSYIATEDEVKKMHVILDGIKGFDLYSYPPRKDEKGEIIANKKEEKVIFYKGAGCSKCNGTGYTGRIGLFEVLTVSEKTSQLVMQHRSAFEIEEQAKADGMLTMAQDGCLKVLEGLTTMSEVMRVIN